MPKLYIILGYQVSIWANENNEPIHVYISKRRPTANATKLWLSKENKFLVAHNKSRIPEKDLSRIIKILNSLVDDVKVAWIAYHGYEKYID